MWDGEIGVEGGPGKGSTFWFTLPLAPCAAPVPKDRESGLGQSIEQLSGRLLLVEDNPANQIVIRSMLRNLGIEADLAEDGAKALEVLAGKNYQVILMDCQMPVMNGYDATRAIRKIDPQGRELRIIALTANALAGDREKCLASGMDDYLAKPVSILQLREALGRSVEKT